jgi:hypothetical protein
MQWYGFVYGVRIFFLSGELGLILVELVWGNLLVLLATRDILE